MQTQYCAPKHRISSVTITEAASTLALMTKQVLEEEPIVFVPIMEEPTVKVPFVVEEVLDMEEHLPAIKVVVEEALSAVDEISPDDTNATTHVSTTLPVHTDESFQRGPTDRSVLIKYVNHVTFRIWQGKIYML